MEITKRHLKKIIKEEMQVLADTGDLNAITESEKQLFRIILEKFSDTDLKTYHLKRTK
jgi:hypothetical protein